jgi:hypothetical protein
MTVDNEAFASGSHAAAYSAAPLLLLLLLLIQSI